MLNNFYSLKKVFSIVKLGYFHMNMQFFSNQNTECVILKWLQIIKVMIIIKVSSYSRESTWIGT